MINDNELIKPLFSDITIWKDTELRFDIFKPINFENMKNINQVYGFIFNQDNEILMVSHEDGLWNIPGGHTEGNETPLETLIRECYEEAAAIINPYDCFPFFIQKAYKKLDNNWELDELQARYIVKFAKFDKFISDPDQDNPIVSQKFFPISSLKEYLKWGKTTDFVIEQLSSL